MQLGQIGFINFVTKPIVYLLSAILNEGDDKPWLVNMENNLKYWEEKKKEAESGATV